MHRRKFVAVAGGLVVAGVSRAFAQTESGLVMPSKACKPTTRLSVGPYLTESPLRADIREDRPGAAFRLSLRIVDHFSCAPIEGAVVDIWHCDAGGVYSNVENIQFDYASLQPKGDPLDMRGTTFLRGHQIADAQGLAEFTTIFPGWYMGRLPHIHVRTTIGDIEWTRHDTQLFFPPDVEKAVYANGVYAARGRSPLSISRDPVVRGDKRAVKAMTVPVERDGDGFKAAFQIAMDGL